VKKNEKSLGAFGLILAITLPSIVLEFHLKAQKLQIVF